MERILTPEDDKAMWDDIRRKEAEARAQTYAERAAEMALQQYRLIADMHRMTKEMLAIMRGKT